MIFRIIRTVIFFLVGIFSVISLIYIFDAYSAYWNNSDAALGIFWFSIFNIILGMVRVFSSLKTSLPILFRIQDFFYAVILWLPIQIGTNKNIVGNFGQIATVICLISSVIWSVTILIWGIKRGFNKQKP